MSTASTMMVSEMNSEFKKPQLRHYASAPRRALAPTARNTLIPRSPDAEPTVTFRLFSSYKPIPLRLLLAHCLAFDLSFLELQRIENNNIFIDLTYDAVGLDPTALAFVIEALLKLDQRPPNVREAKPQAVKFEQMRAMHWLCQRLGVDFDSVVRPCYYTLNMIERCRFDATVGHGTLIFADSHVWICYQGPGVDIDRVLHYQVADSESMFELADGSTRLRVMPNGDLQLENGNTPLYKVLFRNSTPELLSAPPALPHYGS